MRILMVEDDHAFSGLVGDALKLFGHDVRRVPTIESGIGALLEHRYDVLLLDLNLGMSRGEVLIQRMRNLGEPVPPIIIVSGQPSGEIESAAKSINAAAVLAKPCTMEELESAIVQASGRSVSAVGR